MTKKEEVLKIPKELPVLPVRDIVVFPYMIIPLFVARALSINAIDEALGKDRMIFLATQKDQTVEEPTPDQLYSVGTVALIMRMLKMPDGRIKILVQGVARARTEKVLQEEPGPGRVNFLCMERSFGVFRRVVLPGVAVDISRATAVCRDGILQVRVPKVQEKRGRVRVVPVTAAPGGERSEP